MMSPRAIYLASATVPMEPGSATTSADFKRQLRVEAEAQQHQRDKRHRDAMPVGQVSTRICTRNGPCAPSTIVCSISPVRDGPEIMLTARGIMPRSRRINA